MSNFKELFEIDDDTGSFLYRTDSCMHRHARLTRDEQSLTKAENQRFDYQRKDWNEHELQNCVAKLLQKGHKPKLDETLENFCMRYINET